MSLIAVWQRRYIRERDLSADRAIYMTDDRLNNIVNQAYEAGLTDGKQEGRYEMRKDIEAGRIDGLRAV